MQNSNEGILYSASDLVHFLECQHLTTLDRVHLQKPLQKAKDSDEARSVQNKGFDHERRYLEKLKSQHTSFVDIADSGKTREQKVEATLDAMRQGIEIIYQATFFSFPFLGHADFLRKVPKPSALGDYSYEVIDTKLAKTTHGKFIVQLAFYSDLLGKAQGTLPDRMMVVLGDGREDIYRLADYTYYYQGLKDRFLAYMAKPMNVPAESALLNSSLTTKPFPCDKCELCHWRDRCEQQLDEEDHLSRVANILKTHIRKLEAQGIETLQQLAELPDNSQIRKIPGPVLRRLRHQARLQNQKKIDGELHVELITPDPDIPKEIGDRGFARMPLPDEGDLFFDMEGYPHVENGLEYLFGLYYFEKGKPIFLPFWAHTRKEEKQAFEEWIDFVIDHLDNYPDAHIYHYAAYEKTAITKLMRLHGTREAQVDQLLKEKKLIDLYQVVREAIRVSEPSYSIKYIEKFYLDKRQGDVTNAGSSILFYEKWLESNDDSILQSIADYNEDDVRSTYELQRWLCSLRPQAMPWLGEGLPEDDEREETKRQQSAKAFEIRLISARTQLEALLPEDPLTWTDRERQLRLIADILDFHRRSVKPQWWAVFERQSKNHEERLEDVDCIVGLMPDLNHPPVAEKRSLRHTYRYPEQEVKLKSTDVCVVADTMMSLSELTVNHETQTVTFKLGQGRTLPEAPFDIGLGKPIDQAPLQEALFRYVDSVLAGTTSDGSSAYPAIDGLIRRDYPKLSGHPTGTPIVPDKPTTDEIIQAVHQLDQSHLFIQGPPGAGKTYTGSKVIVSLLKSGKRVGVSSNSHKAIINLLKAVEEEAIKAGVLFKGAKKSSKDDESQQIKGKMIVDVSDKKDVADPQYQLIAGTTWMFSDPALNQSIDFLFVDEAGQVAMGMLIPMAVSSKNIVLLGDQMQLSQPVQGVHPGESGLSVLDYLLEGESTIARERGIFLGVTWRMHPDICRFISDAVYDGRLTSEPIAAKRKLVFTKQIAPPLPATGIHYLPVKHSDCSQSSEEEAAIIKELYLQLLEQSFENEKGEVIQISHDNILVVSPYNMQVNLLKRELPSGARVGTVDKFQGQEAEVVLISMATSSGDELPRNIEFLFSKNRLNVAISRAKCLAVLVCSPDLLSIQCKTPEQMRLVNTLAWVAA